MKHSRILVIATLSLLAACGKDSTSPTESNTVSGTVSFSYTGGGGGSYSATGSIASSTSATTSQTTTWAAGWLDDSDNSTNVVANLARTGGLADEAVLSINRRTTGAGTIATTCSPTTTTSCTLFVFVIGSSANVETYSFLCMLLSGTITISSISSTKATGSFSGSGTCFNPAAATTAFTVTNGTFDVPLLPNIP